MSNPRYYSWTTLTRWYKLIAVGKYLSSSQQTRSLRCMNGKKPRVGFVSNVSVRRGPDINQLTSIVVAAVILLGCIPMQNPGIEAYTDPIEERNEEWTEVLVGIEQLRIAVVPDVQRAEDAVERAKRAAAPAPGANVNRVEKLLNEVQVKVRLVYGGADSLRRWHILLGISTGDYWAKSTLFTIGKLENAWSECQETVAL